MSTASAARCEETPPPAEESAAIDFESAKSAAVLAILSLVSPATGMAIEMALANRFGASAVVDAYRIAALIVLMGWQLLVIQILPNVTVPMSARFRAANDERGAWRVSLAIANLAVIPITIGALLAFFHPELVVKVLGPGLSGEARQSAVLLSRWFSMSLIPIAWSGAVAGALYSSRIFWIPAAASIAGNLVILASIVFSRPESGTQALIIGIVGAAIVTFVLFAIAVLVKLRKSGFGTRLMFTILPTGSKLDDISRLVVPLLAMAIVSQASAVVINRVLSRSPAGTLASFGYAWKMGQLATLLPAGLATVLYPKFADQWRSLGQAELQKVFMNAMRMAMFIALPLTAIFFALRVPTTALLFHRGAFSAADVETCSRFFGIILISCPAMVGWAFMCNMMYAAEKMWIPSLIQLGSVVLLAAIAPRVRNVAGPAGAIAVCTVLSWLCTLSLMVVLDLQHRVLRSVELGRFIVRIGTAVVVAGCASALVAVLSGQLQLTGVFQRGLALTSAAAMGLLAFYWLGSLLGVPEARESKHYLVWQADTIIRNLRTSIWGGAAPLPTPAHRR